MRKVFYIAGAMMLLAGCSEQKSEQANKDEITTETAQHQNKKVEELSTVEIPKQEKENTEKPDNEISKNTKLALAFFTDAAQDYTLTKNEALTGRYEYKGMQGTEQKKIYKLVLVKERQLNGAPEGMEFYSVYPPKGSYASIVGISDEKLFIGGTQGAMGYQEILKTGKEYDIQTLYRKNKHLRSLQELADKLIISDTHPMADEKTRQEFAKGENPNTMAHARSQVYQMIADYEGKPLEKEKYLWDNVEWKEDGNWNVNYRNQDAEIVGAYHSEHDKVVKTDGQGNKVN